MRTREAVLTAAGMAFAESGFLGTSMADIFARAGVTKGALYFHFASKEELANAVIAGEEEAASQIVKDVLSTDAPPLQKAIDITFRWAMEIQSNPIARAGVRLIIEQGTYTEPMREPYLQWADIMVDLLGSAQERGELERTVDTKAMAEFVVSAFTGAQIVSQVISAHEDLVRRIQIMWQLLLLGMLPASSPLVFFPRLPR
ncbi:MAG TPA: ScbR family autoregulator-binding transcription factor [Actinocrinis sp.]|nr:ScbR family autoregulator-binding transcription factor [Actinocrinis sp.]